MGTLYAQPERNSKRVSANALDSFLETSVKLARKHGITVTEVLAAARVLEMERANDLYVANGDVFDEQIAGIGEELQKVASAIEKIGDSET